MLSTGEKTAAASSSRLPSLGPRGEGWVVLQVVLLIAILGAGFLGPLWTGPARVVGVIAGAALIGCGIGLVVAGVLALRRQLTAYPRPVPGGRLIEDGVFGLVRHPMYGGGVLAALGWGLAMASPLALAGTVVLGVFFDSKSRREEAWLTEQFAEYPAYRRRTRRLIPGLY
jgi:protein-S-isoprenylcysteine O-methyltransferase Ste14